jgi:shikimate kinase
MVPNVRLHIPKAIVLVGLMGAGKTCIGSRLAARLALPFVDADAEIEEAAGCSIADIFEIYGEAAFRDGERRVIARLLDGPVQVIATGGGAFIDNGTRARVRERGISIWLRADIELLLSRTTRRGHRPLLNKGDRRETMERLIAERHPIYAEADIVVDSGRETPESTVERTLAALSAFLVARAAAAAP